MSLDHLWMVQFLMPLVIIVIIKSSDENNAFIDSNLSRLAIPAVRIKSLGVKWIDFISL